MEAAGTESERVSIVDAHHHLWSPDTHAWLPLRPDFATISNYMIDEFLEDIRYHNVVASVHVQAFYSGSPTDETRWLQSIADRTGYPQGIVAFADLSDPNIETVLTEHCLCKNMRGIRQCLDWHPENANRRLAKRPTLMVELEWLHGLGLLERFNLSFDLQIYPAQMGMALKVVSSFPRINFILDHAGFPLPDELPQWRDGIQLLSACPNLTVKLSGWSTVDKHWSVESIRPLIMFLIEAFGVDRCMFASDFPVDKLHGSYSDWYSSYKEIVKGFSLEDQLKLFGLNAVRIYRLSLNPDFQARVVLARLC